MKAKKILVFGENGQVARALHEQLGVGAIFLGRDKADFMDSKSCVAHIEKLRPQIVINAVAYTQVDKAETEEVAAMQVNANTPAEIAKACKEYGAKFVHYSTDYVFDGSGDLPFEETATTNPLNIYGKSKLLGEQLIVSSGCDYLIFRTSWVYDSTGKNFFNTMLRLAAEREELSVVADQFGAPSYAPHLAVATMQVLQSIDEAGQFPSGIYHMCGAGETSWHGFAEAIFEKAKNAAIELKIKQCNPIQAVSYPTPATRPYNSRMSCEKLAQRFGVRVPNWQLGLDEAIADYVGAKQALAS